MTIISIKFITISRKSSSEKLSKECVISRPNNLNKTCFIPNVLTRDLDTLSHAGCTIASSETLLKLKYSRKTSILVTKLF